MWLDKCSGDLLPDFKNRDLWDNHDEYEEFFLLTGNELSALRNAADTCWLDETNLVDVFDNLFFDKKAAIEFYEKLASMNLVADGNFTAFLSRAWDKIWNDKKMDYYKKQSEDATRVKNTFLPQLKKYISMN